MPAIDNGSIPADGGNLLLDPASKAELLRAEPNAAKWIRPYLGAESFLHDIERHCLWLKNCAPHELLSMPHVVDRVDAVRAMRLASAKEATRKKADSPTRFTEDRQPTAGHYLALPRTSSETRRYIPIGFLSSEFIAANDLQIIPGATLYVFGVITSMMHMAWMRITSGRLKSDHRYSVKLTYNTFPWPETDAKQRDAVETAAQAVLDARKPYREAGSSLAQLYDRRAMPAELLKAHQTLDRAVDRCYRKDTFPTDRERVEHLFALYEKLTNPLLPANRREVSYKKSKKKSPRPLPHMGFQAATDADEGHMDVVHEDVPPYEVK